MGEKCALEKMCSRYVRSARKREVQCQQCIKGCDDHPQQHFIGSCFKMALNHRLSSNHMHWHLIIRALHCNCNLSGRRPHCYCE